MVTFGIRLNPVPWRVPPMSPVRSGQHKFRVVAGRDEELYTYQQGVKEELLRQGAVMLEPPYALDFKFSRELSQHDAIADVTNLVKSTEDALQGVVIDNDRNVISHSGWIVEQAIGAHPWVVVTIFDNYQPPHVPVEAYEALVKADVSVPEFRNEWL